MKTSEKIYIALTIVMCLFLILVIANFTMFLIPRLEANAARMFYLLSVMIGIYTLALGITAAVNLKLKKLNTVSTAIQIVVLFLTGYGIPIAIWGIILLVKQNKNANHRFRSIADSTAQHGA